MSYKKKIAFLFGAGAEKSFGLPSGSEYLLDSYFCDKTAKIKEPLRNFFNKLYYSNHNYKLRNDILKSNNINIIKRIAKLTIDNDDTGQIKNILSREEIETWKQNNPIVTEFNALIKDFKTNNKIVIKNTILQEVFCGNELSSEEFANKIKPGLAGILDNYFHTIVDPKQYGPNNFAKIFYYYWSCYFSITDKLVEKNKTEFELFLNKDKSINYYAILDNFCSFSSVIRSCVIKTLDDIENYYIEINNIIKKVNYNLYGVITTNYTDFVQQAFSDIAFSQDRIAYPNGRLSLLEFPEVLEIKDVIKIKDKLDNSKIFFPFIFGQSYVKPVVCNEQIKEFSNVSNILDLNAPYEEKSILIILGYEINQDDNHLNAFIHEYIKNGNKLIFVTDSTEKFKNSIGNLCLEKTENCIELIVNYSDGPQKITQKIFSKLEEL